MRYVFLLLLIVFVLLISRVFFLCPQKGQKCNFASYSSFNITEDIIGEGADDYEYFGFMYIAKNNLENQKYPFSHSNILRYPGGFDFSYGYDGAFAVLVGAVLGIILKNQILAYNLTVISILLTNVVVSYVFFRKIQLQYGRNKTLGLIPVLSALIFGFSPYIYARLYSHLNLAFVAGWPIILFAFLKLFDDIKSHMVSNKTLFYLCLGYVLIVLGSLQYIVPLAVISVIIIIAGIALYKGYIKSLCEIVIIERNRNKIVVTLVIATVVSLIFFNGYIYAFFNGLLIFPIHNTKFTPPSLLDLIFYNGYLGSWWSGINISVVSIEKVINIGIIEVIILIAIIMGLKNRKLNLLIIFLLLFYLILSFGFISLPFYPEGGRFILVICLLLAYLVSVSNIDSRPLWYLFLLGLVVERLFWGGYVVRLPDTKAYDVVKQSEGEAFLNVPLSKYTQSRDIPPYFTGKKIMDGYFHYTADNYLANRYFLDSKLGYLNCNSERQIIIPVDKEYIQEDADKVWIL